MASSADEIGGRVRAIRRQRGLSLEVAAGLAGISKPYLSQLERGERHFNRRGLIENVARALSCSVVDLTGQPYEPADKRSAAAMAAIPQIEIALLDCTLDDVPDLAPRPVTELAAAARMANEHRAAVRYDLASLGIGGLLTELQVAAVTAPAPVRQTALAALVEASVVAYDIAKCLGHLALATQAAERGVDAARRHGDPALIGFASWIRALSLMIAGARRRATSVITEVIDSLATVDPTGPDTLAAEAYGLAQLQCAELAAHSGQADTAYQHLGEAARVAFQTGDSNGLLMHFGPTNVAVWRAVIGVELQEAGKVYEQAQKANIDTDRLSASRVGMLHLALAQALAQEGGRRDADALRHLDLADQQAPQRIRHSPVARELLAELDLRAQRKLWLLDSLRHRFGAAPVR
jgi:transcriptional regulator with XRE-family HTH domain